MAKLTKQQLINLSKRESRQQDIEQGTNLVSYRRVHKSKKAYDRKANKQMAWA
jgi:chloramphenicol 3-O-phosphotransferase